MRLILVRHGETEGNRLRQYIGRAELPLNENGRRQALDTGMWLADLDIDRVYCSPAQRALQTAALILHPRRLLPNAWEVEPRLAEVDFGEWEGLTYEQVEQRDRARLWAWYDDLWNVAPPGGESLRALAARVAEWVAWVVEQHRGETVLAVSHGGPLRWFFAQYVLGDAGQFHAVKWDPGQYAVCLWENQAWICEQGEVQIR